MVGARGLGRWVVVVAVLGVGACAGPRGPEPVAPAPRASAGTGAAADRARPVPYPVVAPFAYRQAVEAGTRSASGRPGPEYWTQWVDYDIEARVDVREKVLRGAETIRYHNRSPHRLPVLVVNLLQNYHAEGVERARPTTVTGGMEVERVAYRGSDLEPAENRFAPGWFVDGTLLYLRLPAPVEPGSVAELELEWSFPIPQRGASGRMGHSRDNLFHLAYWFPQMAVLDDVFGWHTDPFLGNAEFYSDFGNYRLSIDVPAGWLVMSTGTLTNRADVLAPDVAARLEEAERSDGVVHVVAHDETARATAGGPGGRLRWEFAADSVRDVAFSVMRNHAWDAARTPVGDRDGDGRPEYARVDAFWRSDAGLYEDAWRYAQHAVSFLSDITGFPYPWPHMSVVEGGGIIGGGMEFPMMTLIGSYEGRNARALYSVTAHELAHMWLPMVVSVNERRYAWMDEGSTEWVDDLATVDFFGEGDLYAGDRRSYLQAVNRGLEGPIMRWSDRHRTGTAYSTASYPKPATALRALEVVIGEEAFREGYRAFIDRWAYRHPYPWDLFSTFEDVAGQDLDWFWRAWYYESTQDGYWYLDQAVTGVERLADGATRITVEDRGWIPMPVPLRITRSDGVVLERRIPVSAWLGGSDTATLMVPAGAPVTAVEIDAAGRLPDLDRGNNRWSAPGGDDGS